MGKPTGFMEWPREAAPKRSAPERLGDCREFTEPFAPAVATRQAGRCMDCGVPFCHQGCPLGNVIPDFNEHVFHGRWREAYEALRATNNFPEFTGRLCPAPCEAACVLAVNADPVTIEQLEREIIERAWAEGWVVPRLPTHRTGKSIAVVGSGPAGLAAAAQLNAAGHSVVVYERQDKLGGLLRYGIPDFKLDKAIIDRRLEVLQAEGIEFVTGVQVGSAGSPSFEALKAKYDAVVLALGAERPRTLDLPGTDLAGVVLALDFLEANNRAVASGSASRLDARGKRVVILGGGDTGSDCLGTSHRQGAVEVVQVELLPAPPAVRGAANPWPQWPLTFRTSSSQDEGGQRVFARRTTRLEGQDGKLVALHWVEVASQEGKLVDVPGTETRHEVDLLIQAMGFVGPITQALVEQLGVELDARGNVKTDGRFHTTAPGVFCAGDAMRGASLIVWAIADGREAARRVDAFVRGGSSGLPTRGRDNPFGGR
jgi:glutamate synthase (NADPH/NADH) small chain